MTRSGKAPTYSTAIITCGLQNSVEFNNGWNLVVVQFKLHHYLESGSGPGADRWTLPER
jgi:hypothetical protein